MSGPDKSNYFLIGNVIMGIALMLLLFMGSAWRELGAAAMVLWIMLVVAGVYFLMQGKDREG